MTFNVKEPKKQNKDIMAQKQQKQQKLALKVVK